MPFKSKSQQRFLFAKHPRIAKKFAKETNFSNLPEKKKKKRKKKQKDFEDVIFENMLEVSND